jgi:hypothetical protein
MPNGAPWCFQLPAPQTNFDGFATGENRRTDSRGKTRRISGDRQYVRALAAGWR